jgi:O-antigen ligase
MKANAIYQLGLPRVYGFSEEPTYLAWYLLTLGIISIWWITQIAKHKIIKLFLISPIALCFLLTFSGAGIGIFVGIGIPIFFYFSKEKLQWLKYFGITLITVIYFVSQIDIDYSFFEPFINKILFAQGESGNSDINDLHRGELWQREILSFFQNPFMGKGLGYYSYNEGGTVVNFYLMLMLEAGVFPLILLLLFYATIFKKIIALKTSVKPYLIVAFLCGIGHLISQSLFHHPCIWLLFIFIYKFSQSQSNQITSFT